MGKLSQYSVCQQTGRLMFDSRQRQRMFPLASGSSQAQRPTQHSTQWVSGVFPGGKARPERDAYHTSI
jgi:hypothetical protein